MKVVLVTNIPAPYRESVYEYVHLNSEFELTVIFCQQQELDRLWKIKEGEYKKVFLKERVISYDNIYKRYVHVNFDVIKELNKIRPNIVITTGYNPTHLLSIGWSVIFRKKHIAMSDGWLKSEKSLTVLHKILRKIVIKISSAYIGASDQTIELFKYYGADGKKCYYSYLCGNNKLFNSIEPPVREYDLVFSGQFIERKMPLFFVEIVKKVAKTLPMIKVLLMGNGSLIDKVQHELHKESINFYYTGFVQQQELPNWYMKGKVFLFPTQLECWGVVVNEACLAGMPVLTCENTAAAGELVIDGFNGYVLPLDVLTWANKALELLKDKEKYQIFSNNSKKLVTKYTYETAGQGIIDAVKYVNQL